MKGGKNSKKKKEGEEKEGPGGKVPRGDLETCKQV